MARSDIRISFDQLSANDASLYSACRTQMRREYLTCMEAVLGIHNYTPDDDSFMDLIDIKLLSLFSRANRLVPTEWQKAELLALEKLSKEVEQRADEGNTAALVSTMAGSFGLLASTSTISEQGALDGAKLGNGNPVHATPLPDAPQPMPDYSKSDTGWIAPQPPQRQASRRAN